MSFSSDFFRDPLKSLSRLQIKPAFIFGIIILTALIAFETFNYSTTDYALRDLLGNLNFAGIPWATILTIAFCGIDFAGIARMFTPGHGLDGTKETWYLFGAWLLAATMNASLTWWGVSMAIATHKVASTAVVDQNTITKVVPVFVALMVWVIRILIIGSLSYTSGRMFAQERRSFTSSARPRPSMGSMPVSPLTGSNLRSTPSVAARPVSTPRPGMSHPIMSADNNTRPEPSYHSLSMSPRGDENSTSSTRRM